MTFSGATERKLEANEQDCSEFLSHLQNEFKNSSEVYSQSNWNKLVHYYIAWTKQSRRHGSQAQENHEETSKSQTTNSFSSTKEDFAGLTLVNLNKAQERLSKFYALYESNYNCTDQAEFQARGDTFLHVLCAGCPPVSAVSELLNYYSTLEQHGVRQVAKSNDIKERDGDDNGCANAYTNDKDGEVTRNSGTIVSNQNHIGATPLHIAIACSASSEIVKLLIQYERNSYRDSKNDINREISRIPLSSICMKCKILPLHLACSNKLQVQILQQYRQEQDFIQVATFLLQDYPEALWSTNDSGETPLHTFWDDQFGHVSSWPELLSRHYRTYHNGSNLDIVNVKAMRWHVWKKISPLLKEIINGAESCNGLDILISKIPRCPPVFVDAILSIMDHNNKRKLLTYLHHFGADGKLALHRAVEMVHFKHQGHFTSTTICPFSETEDFNPRSNEYNNDHKNDNFIPTSQISHPVRLPFPHRDQEGGYHFKKDSIIDHLLHLAPHVASIPTKDVNGGRGRLPLHLALESGKNWEEGVRSLIRAYPEGVCVQDPLTGMYPFMLAAISGNESIADYDTNACQREDSEWVFTIFSLLKTRPEVLNSHYL